MPEFMMVDRPATTPYHYTECGLDEIYLVNGYKAEVTNYGSGVSIEKEDELLHVIALSLVKRRPMLNGKELRFLRRRMDMTQSELAKVLRTDAQTIARWEKAQSKISGPADGLVRLVYMIETGETIEEEFLERITDLDVGGIIPLRFEDTDDGWKAAA